MEISRWCKPPVSPDKSCEPRQGRLNKVQLKRPSRASMHIVCLPVVSPPANLRCPSGTDSGSESL